MVAALAGEQPVLALEPSCLFTLRDEFPALLPGPDRIEIHHVTRYHLPAVLAASLKGH